MVVASIIDDADPGLFVASGFVDYRYMFVLFFMCRESKDPRDLREKFGLLVRKETKGGQVNRESQGPGVNG